MRFWTRNFCLLLLFLPLLFPTPAHCDEQQQNRARLEQIRKRIEKTNKSLKEQQQEELNLLRDLTYINTSLQEVDRRVDQLRGEQRRTEKKIDGVRREIGEGKRDLQLQEHQLQKRLVALYKEGDTGVLKILFSSSTPGELTEQYTYLSRILEHDKELVADFHTALDAQQERLDRLEQLQKEQNRQVARLKAEREDARAARKLQAQLLSKVRADKSRLHAELAKLKENEKRLKDLLNNLQPQGGDGGVFSALKGRLPWPIKGSLLVGFGTQRSPEFGTLYESHGVEIAAEAGAKVHAVAAGKVVFANWFKGYGNLLILAHDGGYHTLYAKADRLLKKIGDRVEPGEPLAVAGLPGEDGIYFEIRQSGAPVNPLTWLTKR